MFDLSYTIADMNGLIDTINEIRDRIIKHYSDNEDDRVTNEKVLEALEDLKTSASHINYAVDEMLDSY